MMNLNQENPIELKKNGCEENSGRETNSSSTYPSACERRRTLLPLLGFCSCFYIGIIGWNTLFPQYILENLRAKNKNATIIHDYCNVSASDPIYNAERKYQQRVALIISIASTCSGIPCMIMVLIYSSISDQLGRKISIIIPYVGGSIVGFTITMIVIFEGPLWLYFIANFFNGLSGSSSAIFAGIFASVADVTPPERRSTVIAIIQSSVGIAMILSNLLMGIWAQKAGFTPPAIFLSALIVCSGGFFFIIGETRPRSQILQAQSLGLFGSVRKQLKHMKITLVTDRHRLKQIIVLVTAFTLGMVAFMGRSSTITLYVLGQPFCWDRSDVGNYNASLTAVSMVGTTLAAIFLKKFFSDLSLAIIGGLSLIGFFIMISLASWIPTSFHNILMFVAIPVGLVSTLPSIALKGLGSSLLSKDEQGAFFGIVAIGEAFGFNFGPVIMNGVYTATVTTMNFFVYFLCSGLLVVMLLLLIVFKKFLAEEKSSYDMTNLGFHSSESIATITTQIKEDL